MGRFLKPVELKIWTAFAVHMQMDGLTVYYEVPLTKITPGARYIQKDEENWWERITALRIDVLWESGPDYQLAEVEETLTMEAIGQALCYRELWNELNPSTPIKNAWVITAGDDPRLHAGLNAAGLSLHLINVLP